MFTYQQVRNFYIHDHLSKNLKQPERRLNALNAIESIIKDKSPDLLNSNHLFKKFNKSSFIEKYSEWKENNLSGAEKSVINGLFKFSEE